MLEGRVQPGTELPPGELMIPKTRGGDGSRVDRAAWVWERVWSPPQGPPCKARICQSPTPRAAFRWEPEKQGAWAAQCLARGQGVGTAEESRSRLGSGRPSAGGQLRGRRQAGVRDPACKGRAGTWLKGLVGRVAVVTGALGGQVCSPRSSTERLFFPVLGSAARRRDMVAADGRDTRRPGSWAPSEPHTAAPRTWRDLALDATALAYVGLVSRTLTKPVSFALPASPGHTWVL